MQDGWAERLAAHLREAAYGERIAAFAEEHGDRFRVTLQDAGAQIAAHGCALPCVCSIDSGMIFIR